MKKNNGVNNRMLSIKHIRFPETAQFWKQHLWPNRESVIEPVSCIDSTGEIDESLPERFTPSFIGLFIDNTLSGVVSVCQTSATEARLRGVCLTAEKRGMGYVGHLLEFAFNEVFANKDIQCIWTMSREHNFKFYSKYNFISFKKVSQYEYGPHIILKNSEIKKTLAQIQANNPEIRSFQRP